MARSVKGTCTSRVASVMSLQLVCLGQSKSRRLLLSHQAPKLVTDHRQAALDGSQLVLLGFQVCFSKDAKAAGQKAHEAPAPLLTYRPSRRASTGG